MLRSLCTTALLVLSVTATAIGQTRSLQQGTAGQNIGSNIGFSNTGEFLGQGANAASSEFGLSNRFQSDFSRFTTRSESFVGAAGPTGNVFSGQQMASGQLGGMGGLSNFGGMGGLGTGLGGLGGGFGGMGGLGGMGGFGMGGFGGFGGMGGFGGGLGGRGGNQFGSMQQNRNQPQLRTRLTIGFEGPAISSSAIGQRIEGLISRVPQIQSAAGVRVQMEGQTAVLQGSVSSQHERELAARLTLLEPGVAAVRNELIVATD